MYNYFSEVSCKMQIFQENQSTEMHIRILEGNILAKSRFHWHKNCEICYLLNKPSDFWVDGEMIKADVGDIVVINEYNVHNFLVREKDTKFKLLLFRAKTVMHPNIEIVPLKTHITAEEIRKVDGLEEKIQMLYSLLWNEDRAAKVEDNPLMQTLIASFYLLLMRYFPGKIDKKVQKQRMEFYKIVNYINEHYKENINVQILAEKLFMSRGKLSQLFLKYSDMSINDYVDKMRVDNVNMLIKDGLNVTEAAFESGFQTVRTFNNTYKKIMKISPSEYLKKFSKQF